jgi:hypothetical protein
MPSPHLHTRLIATAAVLAMVPTASFAFEANAVAARLQALYSAQGGEISWTGIDDTGTTIVLQGTTIGGAGMEKPFPLGDVTLEGVADDEEGGYLVEAVRIPDIDQTNPENARIQVGGIALFNLELPAEGASGPFGNMMLYTSMEAANLSVTAEGTEIVTMSGIGVDIDLPDDGTSMSFEGGVDAFSMDLGKMMAEKPEQQAVLTQLGYDKVTGDIGMAGDWNAADGRINVSEMSYTVNDAGSFDINVDLSGYTMDFIKALQANSKNMQGADENKKAAAGMAMMGLMQQLTFNGATIRFDDDSLTGKALKFIADQQGVSPGDVANMAKGSLPFALAQLQNPEFAQQVTAAVSAYLDDPKSLQITAKPSAPIPFAMLMATGMSAPQTLPQQLGVTVTANQ